MAEVCLGVGGGVEFEYAEFELGGQGEERHWRLIWAMGNSKCNGVMRKIKARWLRLAVRRMPRHGCLVLPAGKIFPNALKALLLPELP